MKLSQIIPKVPQMLLRNDYISPLPARKNIDNEKILGGSTSDKKAD